LRLRLNIDLICFSIDCIIRPSEKVVHARQGSDLQRQISLPCLCYLRCALIPHCDPSCTNFQLIFILVAIENLGIQISAAADVGELSFRLAFPRVEFSRPVITQKPILMTCPRHGDRYSLTRRAISLFLQIHIGERNFVIEFGR
jgi:hypothetical protein